MRLLLVEDHPVMRLGVRGIVQQRWPDADVVECAGIAEARKALAGERFDLAILDLSLPDASGLEGLVQLRRAFPDLPILVLSMHAEAAYATRALQLGAAGYVTKDHAAAELLAAIAAVHAGERYISRTLALRIADLLGGSAAVRAPHERLSAQEYRVMLLIAAGTGPSEIAATMHISVKTVGTYRARILEKTGCTSTAEIVRYCLQHDLLDGK